MKYGYSSICNYTFIPKNVIFDADVLQVNLLALQVNTA